MNELQPQSRPVKSDWASRYATVRAQTMALVAPLSAEDCQVQSMPDASPTKWHLAHVTWFFETFVLERFEPGFAPFHPEFRVLFNSYYQAVGAQHPRPQRGLVTRPTLSEVQAYRAQVDERMHRLLEGKVSPELAELVELGLQHEQQHQELLLTDIKHLLAGNPLQPVYAPRWPPKVVPASASAPEHESSFTCGTVVAAPLDWVPYSAGLTQMGHSGEGFAFDNESPRHSVMLGDFALANRLVTHGEWLAFMDAGGYRDPRWWMSAGWDWVRAQQAQAPLYWQPDAQAGWSLFTLHGRVPIDPHSPVVHISWFEADAFARWSAERLGLPVRLPTEAEWEHAAQSLEGGLQRNGNFAESGALHPMPVARQGEGPLQMGGDVWEWTGSSYLPYPGYAPWAGAVGEYNGKFMVNQMVLRGGSCVTPSSHIRPSYRNFFPTDARWQFTGLRLAYSLPA